MELVVVDGQVNTLISTQNTKLVTQQKLSHIVSDKMEEFIIVRLMRKLRHG